MENEIDMLIQNIQDKIINDYKNRIINDVGFIDDIGLIDGITRLTNNYIEERISRTEDEMKILTKTNNQEISRMENDIERLSEMLTSY